MAASIIPFKCRVVVLLHFVVDACLTRLLTANTSDGTLIIQPKGYFTSIGIKFEVVKAFNGIGSVLIALH